MSQLLADGNGLNDIKTIEVDDDNSAEAAGTVNVDEEVNYSAVPNIRVINREADDIREGTSPPLLLVISASGKERTARTYSS